MIALIDLCKDVGDQNLVINLECEAAGFRFFELYKYPF
jgi:hypothetical protein